MLGNFQFQNPSPSSKKNKKKIIEMCKIFNQKDSLRYPLKTINKNGFIFTNHNKYDFAPVNLSFFKNLKRLQAQQKYKLRNYLSSKVRIHQINKCDNKNDFLQINTENQ